MKCPACEGKGHIDNKWEEKSMKAKYLRSKGMTYRDIKKAMNFKSVNTAFYYVKKGIGQDK